MPASNYLDKKILDHILGKTTYTAPATLYIALHTADPTKTGDQTNHEASGANYARIAVTNNTTNFPNATSDGSDNGIKSNGADIQFATPGVGGWGTITHVSVGDAASGAGNILFTAQLEIPNTIAQNNDVKFPAGTLAFKAN